jgi:hypothetical protein
MPSLSLVCNGIPRGDAFMGQGMDAIFPKSGIASRILLSKNYLNFSLMLPGVSE